MEYALEIKNLTYRYGKRTLYEDLNLAPPLGKVYGLLGKNGVEKTTLIKILMGFRRPFSGMCRVMGGYLPALSPATRRKMGLLFEGHLAYDFMSAALREAGLHFPARFVGGANTPSWNLLTRASSWRTPNRASTT